MKFLPTLLLATLAGLLITSESRAQLFGERNLGGGISRRSRPEPASEGPQLRSIDPQRFDRDARPAGAFVGGVDPAQGFVGGQVEVPTAAIRSAIDATLPRVPLRRASQINRPLPPATAAARNPPRYVVPEPPRAVSDQPLEPGDKSPIERRLAAVLERHYPEAIRVAVQERTAILTGEVPSERDRELAELMIGFEAGVDHVVNRLNTAPTP